MVYDPERGCVRGRRPEELEYDWREVVRVVAEKQAQSETAVPPANSRQVGGDHYRAVPGEQHWDRVARLGLDYFQAAVTKYVERWRHKNGLEDLLKARHYLDKYIELVQSEVINDPTTGKVALPTTSDGKVIVGEVVDLDEMKSASSSNENTGSN